jgi:hypothetical protein
MSRIIRKTKPASEEPSLKERLSASFLAAFEADFKTNGITVIEKLRVDDPGRYVEVGAKLISAVEQPAPAPGGFSRSDSQADIALRLLVQAGLADESAATESMIEQAVAAQLLFVETLERIAKGN